MSSQLFLSIIFITLALFFYSLGVWSEKIRRYLKTWHVISFWIGFLFDLTGTLAMHLLAEGPFDLSEPHTFTGQIALWLMFFHAIWATLVVRKGSDIQRKNFHKYSLFVWIVWFIAYLGGVYLGMNS